MDLLNILESLYHDMTKPDSPAHMGEAFFMWTYFMAVSEARTLLLIMTNHTKEPGLKELMEHFIADVLEPQIDQVKKKLVDEGISLPVVTPDPPKADQAEIPPGAKLVDQEIAKMIMVKVLGLLDLSYQGLRFSFRSDVGAMFARFQGQVLAQGYPLREMMLKRGWISYPPVPPGSALPRA
jgi:hypothetical protein